MAFDALTAANMVGSKITVAERWLKLYRKIHFLFLRNDFTNRKDFEFTINQINLRMDTMEANILSMLSQQQAQITALTLHGGTHFHIAPQAPAGTLPTTPAIVPPIVGPAAFLKSPPALTTTTFVEQRDAILQATGEPVVPL